MTHPKHLFLVLFTVLLFTPKIGFCLDGELDTIKDRIVQELLKTPPSEGEVLSILDKIQEDGSFKDINYEDLSRTAGFPHRRHTLALVHLAKAYKDEKSPYHQDKTILETISKGLGYWVENDFVGDNWHNNQISTPTNLVNLMLLLGDELPKTLVDGAQPMIGRAHMEASGARPSGDRIVIAGILAKNLLFIEDKETFDDIITIIAGEVKFSTGKRGMQHDYSFHHRHDRVNNTTSYGYGKYANAFGEWSYYVAGTSYAFDKKSINQLVDYYLEGIYKQLVYGIYEDISVKNRSIANKTTFQPKGTDEIHKLLSSTDYRSEELKEILALREGRATPTKSFAKFFWQTEHFVVQRPNYYTTVRMYSTRNRNMEVPYNGPGITTHHRADGTNYLFLEGDEYHDIWPVYDWQKISGTTILQKPQLHGSDEIQVDGLTDFVGAVTDGLYGAVAFDFISGHDSIQAKKSWFFFEDIYVCLGTDIKAEQDLPVATTINQVLMNGEVQIVRKNRKPTKLKKGDHSLKGVNYVYHDRIGYAFPEPTAIKLSNQEEQGRWSDLTLQKNISRELIKKDVFTLWFDHGKQPENGSYSYMVLPDIDADHMFSGNASDQVVRVLANDGKTQAVAHQELGMYQVIFYEEGEITLENGIKVASKSPGMAQLKVKEGVVTEIHVSDPSRKQSFLTLTLSGQYSSENPKVSISTSSENNQSELSLELPEGVYAGSSIGFKIETLP
ncbi:polysaccharide lyase family 8 super-sandwich domain-containing protein [Pleomorphovibrio marinus]|uniref:polysaccharide lyase family 8 super-sandwich domain-containing protein n=1 Tax=Pleomorphovibrio marinus TaxID=2164132 RepID=UPI000E0A917A|nr:polysaccharide lyase family 8 super-sandwich domain-containing protein [Pleomorphovibrio marinus]